MSRNLYLQLLNNSLASNSEFKITLGKMTGFFPFNWQLDRLKVTDREGEWLAIDNLHLDWSFLSLLDSQLEINRLSASSLVVKRIPLVETSEQTVDKEEQVKSNDYHSNFTINLKTFNIKHLQLAKQLLLGLSNPVDIAEQQFLSFALQGDTLLDYANESKIKLQLKQINYLPFTAAKNKPSKVKRSEISSVLKFTPNNKRLAIQIAINLKHDLLHKLEQNVVALPAQLIANDLKFNLSGDAPWDQWLGKLHLSVVNMASVQSKIQLNFNNVAKQIDLNLDNHFLIDKKLLHEYQLADKLSAISLQTSLSYLFNQGKKQLFIHHLKLATFYSQLQSKGSIDLNQQLVKLKTQLVVDDVAQLNDFLTLSSQKNSIADLKGRIKLTTDVSGDWELPKINYSLNMADVLVNGIQFTHSHSIGSISLVKDKSINNSSAIEIESSGQFTSLHFTPLKKLPKQNIDWLAKLKYSNDKLEINNVAVKSELLQFDLGGELNTQDLAVNLKSDSFINDLSPLSAILEQPIAGSIQQSLTISGSLKNPQLALSLKGDNLIYNQFSLGQLNTQLDVSDAIQNPQGTLDLSLKHKQQKLKLSSRFQLQENIFHLSKVNIQAPKTQLNGQMSINLQNKLIKGSFSGELKELSELSFLHQQQGLAGDIKFNITLDEKKSLSARLEQLIYLNLHSKQLVYDNVNLESLKFDGKVSGLQPLIRINSSLDIKKITYAKGTKQQQIAALNLTAKGNPKKIQLNIKLAEASEKKHYVVNLSSEIKQKNNNLTIILNKLDGAIYKQAIKLIKPAQIRLKTASQLEITPLTLTVAKSKINLEAKLDQVKDTIRTHLQISDFPLELLAKFNVPQSKLSGMKGNVKLNLLIEGKLSQPEIKMESKINQLSLYQTPLHQNIPLKNNKSLDKDKKQKQLPLLDIKLNASLRNKLSKVYLDIAGLTEQPISTSIQLPLQLSLLPYQLDLDKLEKQPIKGQFNANINLSKLSSWLELDQQLVAGQLIANLKLVGNIASPKLMGGITLKQGKYENAQLGTLIHDINMTIKAENQSLKITQLQANDSENGKINATGEVMLDPSSAQNYQLTLALDKVKLLRHDDLTMTLSGSINLSGDNKKGKIQSQIKINKGEFFLPESVGADIPELEVVEINKPGELKKVKEKETIHNENEYPMDLDIRIVVPSQMYVRGRGLESEWQGEILIKQQLSDPIVAGNLKIKRGYFNFMSNRFDFRKGSINFVGSLPPQPQLDFEMATKGKDVTAVLKISGDAEKPDIKLSSEPMMPDDEILSRLLFNKKMSEISAFEALQLASAVRTLTTGGSGLMDKTRSALGIDSLDFNGDGDSGSSVKVGKNISENVYVEVISGMTSGESQVKVEMDLTDHISIESRVDQESNTGAGVNWKFDY